MASQGRTGELHVNDLKIGIYHGTSAGTKSGSLSKVVDIT